MTDSIAQQLQDFSTPGWLQAADTPQLTQSTTAPPAATQTSVDPFGAANLSQTALGLVAVIGLILLCAMLLKRFGPYRRLAGGRSLKLVAGQSVGSRERVVVLEVEDTWLVLGVTQNNVNVLHKLPARHDSAAGNARGPRAGDHPTFKHAFAENFRQACARWSRH